MEGAKVGEKINCNIKTLSYLCIATDFLNSKALHRVDIGDNLFWLFENCCKFPVLSGEGLFVFIMAREFFKKEDLVFQPIPTDGRFRNLTGMKFNRLCVTGYAGVFKKSKWFCECECGNIIMVYSDSLIRKVTESCGCIAIKHGFAKNDDNNKTYQTWEAMKSRCNNPNAKHFDNYGGRGIKVCSRWDEFENFLEDMGTRPEGMTIERDDPNGDYCKKNCRWATRKEQQNNMRANVVISFMDKTMTLAQWSEHTGISYHAIRHRRKIGWSVKDMLTTPVTDREFRKRVGREKSTQKLQSNA